MNFEELKRQVELIDMATGDAVMEIEHRIDLAEQMEQRWREQQTHANHRNTQKQVRQWQKQYIQQQNCVVWLTDLLSVARTIICEHCGHFVDDPTHVSINYNGGGFEPNEQTCEINGVFADDYCPF